MSTFKHNFFLPSTWFSHILRDRLISGSVGTIVYYGFQCNANARSVYLIGCLINGLAGTVIPFWDWFDRPENKVLVFTLSTGSISLMTPCSVEMAHRFLPHFDHHDHAWSFNTTCLAPFYLRHRCFHTYVSILTVSLHPN
jgi:hypothetical protein